MLDNKDLCSNDKVDWNGNVLWNSSVKNIGDKTDASFTSSVSPNSKDWTEYKSKLGYKDQAYFYSSVEPLPHLNTSWKHSPTPLRTIPSTIMESTQNKEDDLKLDNNEESARKSETGNKPVNITKWIVELDVILELFYTIGFALWGILVGIVVSFVPRRFRYKDVRGQVVLITGAGSGIGRLMAKKFATQHHCTVVAWDINTQGNEETVKMITVGGGRCHGYTVDVSSRTGIYEAAQRVKRDVGKVDILINNAGIVWGKRLMEIPDESIIKTFEVNALSNFWTTKAFLPDMLASGRGHIVTVASLAGLCGTNRLVDYCASKFAAVGFDEALKSEIKAELGHKDIHATLVCPYYINTGMFNGVRSKIIPLLSPEPVCNDIVAGILTNQEQIVIPRYVYILVVLRLLVPGEVGRRVANAVGISGAMLSFKGSVVQKPVAEAPGFSAGHKNGLNRT